MFFFSVIDFFMLAFLVFILFVDSNPILKNLSGIFSDFKSDTRKNNFVTIFLNLLFQDYSLNFEHIMILGEKIKRTCSSCFIMA